MSKLRTIPLSSLKSINKPTEDENTQNEIYFKVGATQKGSCYFESEKEIVLTSVKLAPSQKIETNIINVQINNSTNIKLNNEVIKQAIVPTVIPNEIFYKNDISIDVFSTSDNLAMIINCISLSLADYGIELYEFVVAASGTGSNDSVVALMVECDLITSIYNCQDVAGIKNAMEECINFRGYMAQCLLE